MSNIGDDFLQGIAVLSREVRLDSAKLEELSRLYPPTVGKYDVLDFYTELAAGATDELNTPEQLTWGLSVVSGVIVDLITRIEELENR